MSHAADYWESRALKFAHVEDGLPAVCSYGMPKLYNWTIHQCQRRALTSFLRQCKDMDILDVGCGVGRWSLEFAQRGNRVVGMDLSPRMIDVARSRASARRLNADFQVQDVTALNLGRTFDLVIAVTVLQHVMSDTDCQAAIEGLGQHLNEQGTLVLLEVAPELPTGVCDSGTFRARTLADYCGMMGGAGIDVVDVRGVDFAPLRPLLLPAMKRLRPAIARSMISMSALLSLPLDLALSRLLTDLCWHKVIVGKRA